MKLLFVTGGESCECGGGGTLNKEVSLGSHIFIIRVVCHCVRAKGATVEELVDHGVHKAIERSGSVVPKPDGLEHIDIKFTVGEVEGQDEPTDN